MPNTDSTTERAPGGTSGADGWRDHRNPGDGAVSMRDGDPWNACSVTIVRILGNGWRLCRLADGWDHLGGGVTGECAFTMEELW